MQKKLLIIAQVWPEPNTTAAGGRMLQLIQCFEKQAYQITIASTASESQHSLTAPNFEKVHIQLNHSSFDLFISKLKPDMVLFDRFLSEEQFGWRVAESVPNAIRILDTEDLHSLRKTREKAFKSKSEFSTDLWLSEEITKREISSIYRSDLTLVISSYEMYLLKDIIGIDEAILCYLPFLLEPLSEETINNWNSFENRQDFIFIGNGKHAPNVDAIVWLKTKIWPTIRKALPKAQLRIYGAYMPVHIQQMHQPKKGFLVHGWVADANQAMQEAKINLVPLRFGAGLKGKLITAMQNGTPSVTTPIGAEGMLNDLEWSGAIENTAEAIALAAIDLHTNKGKWQAAQKNGVQISNELFSKEKWTPQFTSQLGCIGQNIKKHRAKNFMGAMLQQQTTASSKYLSKWIEEKNR